MGDICGLCPQFPFILAVILWSIGWKFKITYKNRPVNQEQ